MAIFLCDAALPFAGGLIDYSFSMSTIHHQRTPIGQRGPGCLESAISAVWNESSSTSWTGSFPYASLTSLRSSTSTLPPSGSHSPTHIIITGIIPSPETPSVDLPHATWMTTRTGAAARTNFLPHHQSPMWPLGPPFTVTVRTILGNAGSFLQVS